MIYFCLNIYLLFIKEEITNMIHCQVVSLDIRGHGETKAVDPDDLSIETLVK